MAGVSYPEQATRLNYVCRVVVACWIIRSKRNIYVSCEVRSWWGGRVEAGGAYIGNSENRNEPWW